MTPRGGGYREVSKSRRWLTPPLMIPVAFNHSKVTGSLRFFAVADTGIGTTHEQQAKLVRGVQPGRRHNRAEVRRHWARARHHTQARAHDGRRRDGDERAGQRLGIYGATAGGLNPMNLPRRRFLHLAAGAAALPAMSRVARAQAYPTRPVRIIVGFADE